MLRLKDSVGYAIVFVATCTCRKCGITGSTGTGGGLHDLSGIIISVIIVTIIASAKTSKWANGRGRGSSGRLSHPGNPPASLRSNCKLQSVALAAVPHYY